LIDSSSPGPSVDGGEDPRNSGDFREDHWLPLCAMRLAHEAAGHRRPPSRHHGHPGWPGQGSLTLAARRGRSVDATVRFRSSPPSPSGRFFLQAERAFRGRKQSAPRWSPGRDLPTARPRCRGRRPPDRLQGHRTRAIVLAATPAGGMAYLREALDASCPLHQPGSQDVEGEPRPTPCGSSAFVDRHDLEDHTFARGD
jgi:hypothetical protein